LLHSKNKYKTTTKKKQKKIQAMFGNAPPAQFLFLPSAYLNVSLNSSAI